MDKDETMSMQEAIDFGKMWLDINPDATNTMTYQFIEMALGLMEKQKSFSEELEDIKAEIIWYSKKSIGSCDVVGVDVVERVIKKYERK